MRPGKSKKPRLQILKEVLGSKKKVTKVCKFIKIAPNKRQIMKTGKSRIKVIYKRIPVVKRDQSANNFSASNQENMSYSDILVKPNSHLNITYGFIGLTTFGKALLLKLVNSGLEISLWDPVMDDVMKCVKDIKGIKQADSPAELIKNCDVTFCCYESNTNEFLNILYGKNGILKGFEDAEKLERKPGYVHLTCIDCQYSEIIDKAAKAKNAMYLEAPISETCGEVFINATGDKNLFTKCEKCFELITSKCVFLGGEFGLSSVTNMLLKTATGIVNCALSESAVLLDKLEIDVPRPILGAIFSTMIDNTITETVQNMGICATGTTEDVNLLKHFQQNIDFALKEAGRLNHNMPVTEAANEALKNAIQLYSDEGISTI